VSRLESFYAVPYENELGGKRWQAVGHNGAREYLGMFGSIWLSGPGAGLLPKLRRSRRFAEFIGRHHERRGKARLWRKV